jgi:hypothetical protein
MATYASLNPNFATFTGFGQKPKIPDVLFSNAQDVALGFLCPDYPLSYVGATSGEKYITIHSAVLLGVASRFNEQAYPAARALVNETNAFNADGTINWVIINEMHQKMWTLCMPSSVEDQKFFDVARGNMIGRSIIHRYMQNPAAIDMLLKTTGSLVYVSTDPIFGQGHDGQGHNVVGNYTTDFREAIRTGRKPEFAWAIFSPSKPTGEMSHPRPVLKDVASAIVAPQVVTTPTVVVPVTVAPVSSIPAPPVEVAHVIPETQVAPVPVQPVVEVLPSPVVVVETIPVVEEVKVEEPVVVEPIVEEVKVEEPVVVEPIPVVQEEVKVEEPTVVLETVVEESKMPQVLAPFSGAFPAFAQDKPTAATFGADEINI